MYTPASVGLRPLLVTLDLIESVLENTTSIPRSRYACLVPFVCLLKGNTRWNGCLGRGSLASASPNLTCISCSRPRLADIFALSINLLLYPSLPKSAYILRSSLSKKILSQYLNARKNMFLMTDLLVEVGCEDNEWIYEPL